MFTIRQNHCHLCHGTGNREGKEIWMNQAYGAPVLFKTRKAAEARVQEMDSVTRRNVSIIDMGN